MKTLIVVPAHNEEKKIGEVIGDLQSYGYRDILVVDDGSTDQTSKVAAEKKATVLRHVVNRGLGAALGTGFEYARRKGHELLITFDGDGQHKAKDLEKLILPIKNEQADVVIGSRLINPRGMPLARTAVNYASNLATLLLYHIWTTDTTSGLRAFNRQAIEKIAIKTDRMEVSNEFFMEIRRNNLRLKEISIKPIYTEYSQNHSHNDPSLWQAVSVGKGMLLRLFR
ncbi:glycosyltransferase family 2 protein [Patescibacteria group bacterium]|nr:glycosyltransferase family 2 protein [Patescibacteria group bacterium]